MPHFVRDVEEIRQRAIHKMEDGAVTESYKGDVNKTIEILNEALATEIVCVLRYMHHYFMATGVHAKAVADEFKEHADDEREHASSLAERIQQLGGRRPPDELHAAAGRLHAMLRYTTIGEILESGAHQRWLGVGARF